MKKKRIFLGLGLLSAFTFSLASCVKSNSTTTSQDPVVTTTTEAPSATTTPQGTPTPQGTTTPQDSTTTNGGSTTPTSTTTDGGSTTPTSTTTDGGSTTPTSTTTDGGSSVTPTPTPTTTPQQAVEQFAVTFHYNNGQTDSTLNINDGASVSKPQDPSKAATAQYTFTFVNWYKESNFQTVYDFSSPVTEELNLYAKFDEVVRTYTYNFVNGTSTVKTETINYGEDIVAPTTNPEKQGDLTYSYLFDGWYTAPTGGTKVTSFGTIEGNVTYYARFNQVENKYTIIWENEDGTELTTQNNVSYNSTYPGTEPTKANSTPGHIYILSWDEEIINTTITRRAVFTDALDSFTVTWQDENGNNLEVDDNVTYNSNFSFNGTLPSKTGYVFAYWTQDGTTKFDITTNKVTGNITLRAVYLESYSVGFGGSYTSWSSFFDYGNSGRQDDKSRKYLGAADTTEVAMNGFTFLGKCVLDSGILNTNGTTFSVVLGDNASLNMTAAWGSTNNSGKIRVYKDSTMIYESEATYSSSNKNVSLSLSGLEAGTYEIKAEKTDTTGTAGLKITTVYYSVPKEYIDITFDEMGGIDVQNVKVVKSTAVGNLPTPTRSGYRFEGWYTSNDNGVTLDTLVTSSTTFDSNVTLYAMWYELQPTDLVTVSFAFNNANASLSSIQVEKGTAISEQVAPELAGYRFEGWYTTDGYNTPFNFSTVINDATTIYGKYVQQFTVTYKDQDDNVITTKTVDIDTAFGNIDQVMAPGISGKIFDGWVFEGSTTKIVSTDDITANVVLVATYRDITAQDKKIEYVNQEGMQEAAYLVVNNYKDAEGYSLYSVDSSNNLTKLTEKDYYVTPGTSTTRIDIFGLTAGSHEFLVAPVLGGFDSVELGTKSNALEVQAYDRSGYAHFNYTDGVGAYKDNGQLKENAIVLYVTDENKNTVTLSFHDAINNKDWNVTGIGNILNSAGKDNGSGTNSKGGLANTNDGVILALAQNNIPLVVRFVGCVSDSGAYKDQAIDPSKAPLINGLTIYDSVDYGGSAGDQGHMARMQSGKNITFEGVGDDAIIDGWGFHLICESAYPDLAKSFEVRNLTFMNTPEDAVGMEGQEIESTLTLTASVERCWVHHNTFICPHMSKSTEGDKSEGDGSCDFKRGRYFTCSYNYFENCHKTNLVGSGGTSVQYNMSYHHNYWYNCAARQPLARQGNIHFYNNFICSTSDTVSSLRANATMFAEGNYYLGCSRPVEYKEDDYKVNGTTVKTTGICKSYNNNVIGCYNNFDAMDTTDREANFESPNCNDNALNINFSNFDTNSELFYYDSVNKKSDCYLTDPNQARIDCIQQSGSRYRTALNKTSATTNTDITSTTSSATVSGSTSLTISKGSGVMKVFTVTSPVTITIAATGAAGFDTGYVVKRDGSVVLKLTSDSQTAVLLPGDYAIISCVAFTSGGKNNKETTITTCTFEEYNSEELNQQLINAYNAAHDAIPSTIQYIDAHYNLINDAMTAYQALGDLKTQITNYNDVTAALNTYKSLGQTYVEGLISAIGNVNENSGAAITTARNAYDSLLVKCSDAVVSNYATLQAAENEFKSYAVTACINAINAIGTVEYTNECLGRIVYAESLYSSLPSEDKSSVTNYSTLTQARTTYNSLENVANVIDALQSSTTVSECEAAYAQYNALSSTEKASVSSSVLNTFKVNYTVALINSISNPVVRADKDTIEAARALYDSLDSTYQAQVTNYSTLTAAEEAIAGMSATEVEKTLTASNFDITGVSTTAFSGKVWTGGSVVGISKVKYTDVSKVVLNATREDKSVSYKVSYSLDGNKWELVAEKTNTSNNTAQDLTYDISATGDMYIMIEIVGTKTGSGTAKNGTINSIKVTCYE